MVIGRVWKLARNVKSTPYSQPCALSPIYIKGTTELPSSGRGLTSLSNVNTNSAPPYPLLRIHRLIHSSMPVRGLATELNK